METKLVFDPRLWGRYDRDDNSQFFVRADIIERHQTHDGEVATVRFHHDGRLSSGHFTHAMKEIESRGWLGVQVDHGYEVFPDGTLNDKQLAALLTTNDPRYGRITSLHPATQKIVKLTDDLVEIHSGMSKYEAAIGGRHAVLWLDERGRQVASAVITDDKGHEAESYWRRPKDIGRMGIDALTTQHRGMWSLGDEGAVPQTRKFIRENYDN